MWYRDELWRITTPVWTVYGAFIVSCIGFVWSEKDNISGYVALMLIFVIFLFSWVILRVYWIYSHCIYVAIKDLNEEIRKREQHIYDVILNKKEWTANYGRFRVYPELNVIFTVVGVAMMVACVFMVAASVGFEFKAETSHTGKSAPPSLITVHWIAYICVALVCIFEWFLKDKKKCAMCGKSKNTSSKHSVLNEYGCDCEHPQLNIFFAIIIVVMALAGIFMVVELKLESPFTGKPMTPSFIHGGVFVGVVLAGIVEWVWKNEKQKRRARAARAEAELNHEQH